MPSRPLAALAISLMGVLYTVLPHGRPRDLGKWIVAIVLGAVLVARLILAIEAPTSAIFGAVLGVAIGLGAFRLFVPNDVFPVTYKRGKAAHLDVGGSRGEAIRHAVADQLGERVGEIKPIGLEGSGGSTPLRLTIGQADGSHRYVFAKLYAMSHVRADRWYKLGRTILYGRARGRDAVRLGPPVRRVRGLRAAPAATTPGSRARSRSASSRSTPEREYMILMEFFDGAVEISEAEVDDGGDRRGPPDDPADVGRSASRIATSSRRTSWSSDGHLRLIDVFFVQVRPSPWRQAVDLANMMLVLALRSDAQTVYEHALQDFTPDEIAEAFAAARGVASPTQLRNLLKADERGLVDEFRALAPHRDPIRIQRWSLRRIALTAWVALLAFLAIGLLVSNWTVFS